MRALVSFHVRPWILPKKVSVSLMVNSLYNASSCETQRVSNEPFSVILNLQYCQTGELSFLETKSSTYVC